MIIKRAADKIAQRLTTMQAYCEKQNRDRLTVSREIGRLLGQNTRAAHLFEVNVLAKEEEATTGKKTIKGKEFVRIQWARITAKSDWHELSDGCYLLRSNVSEWSGEQLWKAYIHLTEAENAFRIHKSDLSLRPVWHQKEDRVRAHILYVFCPMCYGKCLGRSVSWQVWATSRVACCRSCLKSASWTWCSPPKVVTRSEIVALHDRPTEHQRILLEKFGLRLPTTRVRMSEM